jgi:NodT family efflux transporter outer membrane factor (OMF) lipoprotein
MARTPRVRPAEARRRQALHPPTSRPRWWTALGTLALALGGCCTPVGDYVRQCFKVGPNYGRPPAPVAKDWIDAGDKRISHAEDDLSHWWTVFNDPVLNDLVADAYRQNLTLRQAGFRVLEARAVRAIAVGEFFPQQQFATGDYTHNAISKLVANSAQNVKRFFDQWDLGFKLAWELDFWGRFRRAIESANASLDASVENYDDVLVTLIGDVATAYVTIRTLEQEIAYLRRNVADQKGNYEKALAAFRGGQKNEAAPAQLRSVLAQTEALIPQLEQQKRQAADQLCVLLGIPPIDLEAKLGAGPIPTAPAEVAIGVPADLLARRPDIRRAERQAAAQCAQIGVAEADLYPHISITGSIGWSAERFTDLLKDKSLVGTIGPSWHWDILNYGRIINNVRLQDATFQELVAFYQNTVLNAAREVEDGLILYLKAWYRVERWDDSVRSSQTAIKVVLANWDREADYNRLSVLQQNLVTEQISLAQSQGDIALGLIQVYRALGGGWQIRCAGDAHTTEAPVAVPPMRPADGPETLPEPKPKPEAAKEDKQ